MTIGLAMIMSGVMSNPLASADQNIVTSAPVQQTLSASSSDAETNEETSTADAPTIKNSPLLTTIKTNAGIKKQVYSYFSDIPVMAEIARCESHYRQYNKDGSPFRGVVNNKDVGVMQINERYHLARAQKLGINIYTVEGNLEYGRLLYKEQGSAPWISSSPCWGKTAAAKGDKLAYNPDLN